MEVTTQSFELSDSIYVNYTSVQSGSDFQGACLRKINRKSHIFFIKERKNILQML